MWCNGNADVNANLTVNDNVDDGVSIHVNACIHACLYVYGARNHGILIKWGNLNPIQNLNVGSFIHGHLGDPSESDAEKIQPMAQVTKGWPSNFWIPRKPTRLSSSVDPGRSCGFTFFCIVVVSGQPWPAPSRPETSIFSTFHQYMAICLTKNQRGRISHNGNTFIHSIPFHTIPYHYITYHHMTLHYITYHHIPLHAITYHYIQWICVCNYTYIYIYTVDG